MKILHTVEFYEPLKGGSEEVIKQISERLVRRGHDVTVATSYHPERKSTMINGVRVVQFDIRGNAVKGLHGNIMSFVDFLRNSKFDIVMNYAAQSWPTDITFKHLDDIHAKKFIMPMGYSKLHHPAYREYYSQLPKYLEKYDRLIYTSPNYQDKKFGDMHNLSDRSVVIRNGASLEDFSVEPLGFRAKYGIETQYMFISVGNHYFNKGHLFVIDAVKMLKRKDFTLVIIGELPNAYPWYSCYPFCFLQEKLSKNIRILRNVPRELVISAYLEADAFLFGSKVECSPLVMYESFASHTPFITRDVGSVKDHSNIIRIVDTPVKMAEEVKNLMESPQYYLEIADRAFNEFKQFYTWEKITGQFEELYKSSLRI